MSNWAQQQFGDDHWKKVEHRAEDLGEDMEKWGKQVGQSVESRVEKHFRGHHPKHDDWAAKHGQPRPEGDKEMHMPKSNTSGHHKPSHHRGHHGKFGKVARTVQVIVWIVFLAAHCHFLRKLIQAKKAAQVKKEAPVAPQVQPADSAYDYSVYLPRTEGADLDKSEEPVIKIEQSPQSYVINSGSNQMN